VGDVHRVNKIEITLRTAKRLQSAELLSSAANVT